MQIRASLLNGDRPDCPVDRNHVIHRHGAYGRHGDTEEEEKSVKVPRFLCNPCGRTISVLPDEMPPYRPVKVDVLEEHFDAEAGVPCEQPQAPRTVKTNDCLKRAWRRFTRRLDALTSLLGQMMQIRASDAKLIWKQLRRLGNLREILRLLSWKFKTSLLGDYQCLKPWSPRPPGD